MSTQFDELFYRGIKSKRMQQYNARGRSLKLVPPLAHRAQSKHFFMYRIPEQWNL